MINKGQKLKGGEGINIGIIIGRGNIEKK